MRLIDADVLEDQLGISDRDIYCKEVIYEAPTVDPVQHGKWNNTYKSGYMPVPRNVCSVCDCWGERRSDYCPNCGAKMDMEEVE